MSILPGFLVGYKDTWANNRDTVVISHFHIEEQAYDAAVQLEIENKEKYYNLREVFVVDLSQPKLSNASCWLDHFTHYILRLQDETFVKN